MSDTRTVLIGLLAARPGLTQHEIAARAGISVRTARRHLTSLVADTTVLVEADGPARRYRLADHAQPAATLPMLSEGEIEALCVAALAARPLLAPTPFAAVLDAVAAKLRRAWLNHVFLFEPDADTEHWSFDGAAAGESPPADGDLFRELLAAMRGGNPVVVDYYTASRGALTTDRRLVPLGFLVRNGAWLVVALDPQNGAVKDFSPYGFRRLTRLEAEHVPPPEGFDLSVYSRDRFGALDGDVELVRVLVEPEAVEAFRRRDYHPTQQIEEERADGRAVVSFEAGGREAVKAWALSWGPKVRVLEPEALAEQVAEAARAAAAMYDDPSRQIPLGCD